MLEQLVDTLLYEGYALYPYTPGATKNATPTPFGIVYPPVYAAGSGATFDHLQIECVADGSLFSGEIRFLQASGVRHKAEPRRIVLPSVAAGEEHVEDLEFDGLRVRASIRSDASRMRIRVENHTEVEPGLDRTGALLHSLLSTHVIGRVEGGRFTSPLEAKGCENVNSWPVLATQADDAVLGAAIMLPDHPQIAPESKGNLFDSTEIEEALLIHVLALSDAEREAAAEQDPAVRQMLERAARTTPQELMDLHGRVQVADPRVGEPEVEVGGVRYRLGDKVVLRPETNATPQDHLVAGRPATIERIYYDYDGTVHLAVTVDDVPGQELMRDIGRYLYFKTTEVVPA
ncbi:MAG: hypothetical protein ACXW08_11585 [Solirubrobacteraceae bacterium]